LGRVLFTGTVRFSAKRLVNEGLGDSRNTGLLAGPGAVSVGLGGVQRLL